MQWTIGAGTTGRARAGPGLRPLPKTSLKTDRGPGRARAGPEPHPLHKTSLITDHGPTWKIIRGEARRKPR